MKYICWGGNQNDIAVSRFGPPGTDGDTSQWQEFFNGHPQIIRVLPQYLFFIFGLLGSRTWDMTSERTNAVCLA